MTRRRTRAALLVGGAAAALLAGCAAPASRTSTAPAAGTAHRPGRPHLSLTAAGALPADCTPSAKAPPYQLGVTGTITNGSISAGPTSITGIDAKICGIVSVTTGTAGCAVEGTITIPVDGQVFGRLDAVVSLVPGQPVTVPFTVIPQAITGSLGCGSSVHGLSLDIGALVAGSTGLFGVSCTIGPISLFLTGTAGAPGGAPATTSFSDISGSFGSDDFAVPTVSPDQRCPSGVAANLDPVAGLPLAPGVAKLSLPFVTSIYQPG